jgi:hypothetical protein
LTDRVRTIVKGGTPVNPVVPRDASVSSSLRDASGVLGGEWRDGCLVVERAWPATANHGRVRVGAVAEAMDYAASMAPFFAGGGPARSPFIFFDLETTGLNGGAGTSAFLIGCGWFDAGTFVTRQFVMTRFADERRMLESVACECTRAGALVSFNGRSFDAPLLETRYLFHRLPWFGVDLPHVDVLHPARQFWKRDECSLQALERQLVGHRRTGDVPGFEIPGRYFQFTRTGDVGPLRAVLEHNRLDLLSLAALTARLLRLAKDGAEAADDAREALALGHVFMRAGLESRARDAYERSITMSRAPRGAYDAVRIDGLRALALAWRRARRFDDAAHCWQTLLEMRGCPAHVACEAAEALAIHNEHRVRDLAAARKFALSNVERAGKGGELRAKKTGWAEAVQHRLARIDRKMKRDATERPPELPSLPWPPSSAAPTSEPRTSS